MNARMPSTIQIVRPTPFFGGGAYDGMPAATGAEDVEPAALFQTSVDAVQAGATVGGVPDATLAVTASSTACGATSDWTLAAWAPAASGTASANDSVNVAGASVRRAPQFQQ